VQSQVGVGSVFSFVIALEAPQQQMAPVHTPAPNVATLPSTLKILLAEDHPANREIAQYFLQKMGCKADVAENGRAAVAALDQQSYDIVLMDCLMPEMDGFEATQQIREKEKKTQVTPVVIIALTANAMSQDRELCLAAGMDDYLSKPLSLQALQAAIARHLPRRYSKAA
jgi:CheY-like chemotaxis protein